MRYNLAYLNFLRRRVMRPVRVVLIGAARVALAAPVKAIVCLRDLGGVFLAIGAREAFLLLFWDNCRAFAALQASFSAYFVAFYLASAFAFIALSCLRVARFSIAIFCL